MNQVHTFPIPPNVRVMMPQAAVYGNWIADCHTRWSCMTNPEAARELERLLWLLSDNILFEVDGRCKLMQGRLYSCYHCARVEINLVNNDGRGSQPVCTMWVQHCHAHLKQRGLRMWMAKRDLGLAGYIIYETLLSDPESIPVAVDLLRHWKDECRII